ncbi:hypothetical protein K443DRAFT_683033 [Laccaria amethystina LaAM-08-1]|uniref:Uncharacterized protein n=1 Tax=Laccaria amethystina LaAM-08-1 TaxID=1095629 RepID=A0A0C9WTT9_9AGAR|nr:hypothetical protein K443DRAFT_683033 [Laccaria amethystina LaAM-08-1]
MSLFHHRPLKERLKSRMSSLVWPLHPKNFGFPMTSALTPSTNFGNHYVTPSSHHTQVDRTSRTCI